jgi:microcin C transport system substrate-binding protein
MGLISEPLEYFRHRHREAAKPLWRSTGDIRDLAVDCFSLLGRKLSSTRGSRLKQSTLVSAVSGLLRFARNDAGFGPVSCGRAGRPAGAERAMTPRKRFGGLREGALGRCALSLALLASLCAAPGSSGASERRHGLSAFGDLKYPADFQHFDYVNPDAPKGGRLATMPTSSINTYNEFNGYILRGDPAEGLSLLFDSLMVRAQDEPDAAYGLIAESAELADDKMSVTFRLRPEARFRDGTAVTADDVVFTFEKLKKDGHPNIQQSLRDVASATAADAHTVTYRFQGESVRDLPVLVATLPVFSKAYYTAHDFLSQSLDVPLGSGPYTISDFRQGTYLTYKRRADYWAAALPVNRGRYNFDEIRFEYFHDRAVGLEAFKAHAYDLREEFTSKSWATEYDIPAVRAGQIVKLTLPDGRPSGAQGMFINTRREKLADPRVREALDYAFDFEWTNKTLFFGMYTRTASYFENSDLKAVGMPSPEELQLLEPFRDSLPAEVFGEVYTPPVTDGSGRYRPSIRTASKLLDDAGWKLQDGVRKNAKGQTLDIEFLIDDPVSERILGPYTVKLVELGINASLRRVDPSQEQERLKTYDFDILTQRYSLQPTPGPEVRAYWGSEAGRQDGSYNLAGIASPAVDALIGKVLNAKSRDELRTAARAVDRVLRAGHYWVPEWYKPVHHVATWDKYSYPEIQAKFDSGVIDTWWYNKEKDEKLGK